MAKTVTRQRTPTELEPRTRIHAVRMFHWVSLAVIKAGIAELSYWHETIPTSTWRLYWNDLPGAAVQFQGRTFPLNPGHLVLMAPATAFKSTWTRSPDCQPLRHLYFHFRLTLPHLTVSPGVWRFPCPRHIRARLAGFVREGFAPGEDFADAFRAASIVTEALHALPRGFWAFQTEEPRVLKAKAFIEADLGRPLDNRQIAQHVSLSSESLIRIFRHELGLTPHQYLIGARCRQVRALLANTDLSLEEIAERCGFSDRAHMTKTFSRQFFQSPAAFRRESRRLAVVGP